MHDSYNIVPVTLAVILHGLVFSSLVVALDWTRDSTPVVPLAIRATLVSEEYEIPQVVREPEPVPEPPGPDPDEQARVEAEEQKRLEDQRIERQRVAEEERAQQERERLAADEKARLEAEAAAERERRLEEERQRREQERLADIERQRQENIAEEQRLLEEQRLALLQAEQETMDLQDSTEMQIYQTMIRQKVHRNWNRPGTAPDNLSCIAVIDQVAGGEVVDVRITECNGDEIVRRSIVGAVRRSSPLPQPSNPLLFLRTFEIEFKVED